METPNKNNVASHVKFIAKVLLSTEIALITYKVLQKTADILKMISGIIFRILAFFMIFYPLSLWFWPLQSPYTARANVMQTQAAHPINIMSWMLERGREVDNTLDYILLVGLISSLPWPYDALSPCTKCSSLFSNYVNAPVLWFMNVCFRKEYIGTQSYINHHAWHK